jgi:SAM-dependent methyltransferase
LRREQLPHMTAADMSTRRALINALRQAHLIGAADRAAGVMAGWKARKANADYAAAHAGAKFPPPTLIYEVQGYATYDLYDTTGLRHADALAALLREAGLAAAPSILEWGCGPTRILARLPAALNDRGATYFGCDPHRGAIAWASKAYPPLKLQLSGFDPPLPWAETTFDAVYGVSILTHLGEASARAWVAEIARVLKPGGIAILTTHGERAAGRLSLAQRARFDAGDYVELGGAAPGSRVYASYMNAVAGQRLFGPHFVAASLRVDGVAETIGQDVWVLRKQAG